MIENGMNKSWKIAHANFNNIYRIPPQLEENHVAPPSSQDEALASYSVSVEALRSILKFKTIVGNFSK